MSIVPPTAALWTPAGVAFLRRVMAGEVYTGLSGEALARWATGLDSKPRDYPRDRADFARCMNVYWSAPTELQAKMRPVLEQWSDDLKRKAQGEMGWRWGGKPDFQQRRYYRPGVG